MTEVRYSSELEDITARDQRFVVVVPADSPGPDLCKLVTSAIALGYPSPIIVNWGKDFQKTEDHFGSSHLGKITGTLEYLDWITRKTANEGDRLDDQDLVLVVDAYDIWFQLPPEVLLRRYHEANKKANARLVHQWGAAEEVPMQQSIIISTQKRCFPTIKSGSNLHCDDLPESNLRPDLYGPKTDRPSRGFHEVRPRYVNSGSIMGPAGDMKRYFRRVQETMERGLSDGTELTSDQGIFGEVLGEQEVWRKWRRERRASLDGDLPNDEGTALIQRNFEFHVGLDYAQDMFLPTVYEENDGDFVAINNGSVIDSKSYDLGISPTRVNGLPGDIEEARNPLKDLVPNQGSEAYDWGDLALYVDFFTAAIPAVLHHNAWKNGLKERRVTWWDRTWFFPYLRQLLNLRLTPGKRKALAKIPARGGDRVYWAPRSDEQKRKPRLFDVQTVAQGLDELDFGDVCRYPDEEKDGDGKHWYDEVFRDGAGAL